MGWYGIDVVDRAFSRTRTALFDPFDLWKWAKLAIITFLLGIYGYVSNIGLLSTNYLIDYIFASDEKLYSTYTFLTHKHIIAAIAVLIILILFCYYALSVMEFVFVESLVRNEVKFWNYSRRFLAEGLYLLQVRLALELVYRVIEGIQILTPRLGILEVGVIIVLYLLVYAINSLLSLAIPLSIYRKTGILSAFGLVFANFKKSWQEVVVYWFIRFVLTIGVAILTILLFGIVLLVLGIIFSYLVSELLLWILLISFVLIGLALISLLLNVFLKYHLLSFLEAWFADADIPFFDASVQEPEKDLSKAEVNL